MIEASFYFEYRRWPEVYCGVDADYNEPDARCKSSELHGSVG